MSLLTPAQQQVLILLAQGSTVTAAADHTGIHRNTIANWRRSSSTFRDTWASVQYEQSQHWRDEMQSLGALAIQTVRALLTDEKSSPSVRLRASLAILNMISAPAPAQPECAEARRKDGQVDQALETLLGPLPKPGDALAGLAPQEFMPKEFAPAPPAPAVPETHLEALHNAAQPCTIAHNSSLLPPKPAAPVHSVPDAQSCTTIRIPNRPPGATSLAPAEAALSTNAAALENPPKPAKWPRKPAQTCPYNG